MINSKLFKQGLFFDIETACSVSHYTDLSFGMAREWERRCVTKYKAEYELEKDYQKVFEKIGALEIDVAKVICISIGIIDSKGESIIKSIHGHNEVEILSKFSSALDKMKRNCLIGFNIKGYDIPFLCRKFLVHGMQIPQILERIITAKPWETSAYLFDLMQFWSFGEFGLKSTFGMVCESLGVETPKNILSGGKVNSEYWELNNLSKIVTYCEADVKATIDCTKKLMDIYPS